MQRKTLLVVLAFALAALGSGCGGPIETDAGMEDAPIALDAPASDTGEPEDGGTDAPSDAGPLDGGRDAPSIDAPRDAGPDVSVEVAAAVRIFCEPSSYANCSAPWRCGCDVREPPPADVAACVLRERPGCEVEFDDDLTALFRRGGVTIDEAAIDACVLELEHTYDLCLTPAPSADQFPRSCWDAIVLGLPVGASCELAGLRCAEGAGVCTGGSCVAAPSTEGEPCEGSCATGLACVEGSCAPPVEAGGACSDHEDCAATLPCIGGRCGDPAAVGGSCDDDAECATGLRCVSGACATRFTSTCVVGSADCGAAADCRPSFRNVCIRSRDAGASCENDEQCVPGLYCNFDLSFPGVCSAPPRLGERCSGPCEVGLRCLQDFSGDATCQMPRAGGARCDDVFSRDGGVCEDGLACSLGVCGPAPRVGEPCSDDGRCDTGLACIFDSSTFEQRCAVRQPEGASCNEDRECVDGLFCDFSTFPALCTAPPREGAECNGRCESNLDCRFFSPLGASYCVAPASVGEECGSRCDVGAFCGFDDSIGACVNEVCDWVFPAR